MSPSTITRAGRYIARPYTLRLFPKLLDGGPEAHMVADLSRPAQDWRRSIRSVGGYWLGSFRLEGDVADLQTAFQNWLAYHTEERASGITWEGLIWQMTLAYAGEKRRRSLEDVANAVKATFTTMDYAGDTKVVNGGFESVSGGSPVFDGWNQQLGAGGNVFDSSLANEGLHACGITDDSDPLDPNRTPLTWARQNLNLTPGNDYKLTFYSRGDGTNAGRWALRDPNAAEWIYPPDGPGWSPASTGVPGTTYFPVFYEFQAPAEGEVLLFFFGPSTDFTTAYFDSVEVLEKIEVVQETGWATEEASIGQYGRIEEKLYLDQYPQATSEAQRDRELNERAWPWPRSAGSQRPGAPVLEVEVAGYVFTASFRYLTATGGEDDVDAWISEVVAADCEFLTAGDVQANALRILKTPSLRERAWDVLARLAALGGDDGAGNKIPWVLYVDDGRLVHYKPLDLNPRYYSRGGVLYDKLDLRTPAVSPRQLRPGVVRNMDWPDGPAPPGSPFLQANDSWAPEVEVFADGSFALKPAEAISEFELMGMRLDAGIADREREPEPGLPPGAGPRG